MTSFEIVVPGVVKFSNRFTLSDAELQELRLRVEESFLTNYKFVYDDNGNLLHGVNKSFHIVPAEHLFSLPVRITEDINYGLVTRLEESIHKALLEYVCIYPDVLRSIWWRTIGHVSAYPSGTCLDLHSDNDVNYRPGTTPIDQAAVQHVLSCTAVLNDDFEGGNLFFEYFNTEVEVKKGDILLFPSNYISTHCVKMITAGMRFSYVSWYGHGSPDEARQICPRPLTEVGYQPGKIWMDHLYADCEDLNKQGKFIKSRVFERAFDH